MTKREAEMETLQERNTREKELSANNLAYILGIVKAPLEQLGLSVELTNKDKRGEPLDEPRIAITHPNLPLFRSEILGREWNDKARATIWFDTDYSTHKNVGKYSDGSSKWETQRYEFESFASTDELLAIGLVKQDYRINVSQLRTAFKATKNPKLILNDVLPVVKKYLAIVELVSPRLFERINKEENTVRLINLATMKQGKGYYEVTKPQNRSLDFDGIGTIEFSECGSIKLVITKQLTEPELLELINNYKPSKGE